MKKYFVLALVVMAFVVAPVMADVALSGEFDYSGTWNVGDKEYDGETDKMELDFKAMVDDYNTVKFELEDDQSPSDDNVRDEPLTLNYVTLATDWGKYFGFAESGFGLMTTVGIDSKGYKEVVDFTNYNLEYSDSIWLTGAPFYEVAFDVMGMVKPYYTANFDNMTGNGTEFVLGATVDFAPIAAEVYYGSTGKIVDAADPTEQYTDSVIGLEAVYSGEVSDGVELTTGGHFVMDKSDYDEFDMFYGFGAAVDAYGATVGMSFNGTIWGSDKADAFDDPNYAFKSLGVEAEYAVLEWMGVNAGALFAFGDYAELECNDESFLGAEFGVTMAPGAVKYGLGYIVTSEDAVDASGDSCYSTAYAASDFPLNGGIYFLANVNF